MTREAPRQTLVAETEWLAQRLDDPGLRVVDIRGIILGHPDVANFAGSWYEWEADPDNPAQLGE